MKLRQDALSSGVTPHGVQLEALQDLPDVDQGPDVETSAAEGAAGAWHPSKGLRYDFQDAVGADDTFILYKGQAGRAKHSDRQREDGRASAARTESARTRTRVGRPTSDVGLVFFRVARHDPSRLKRPLTAVDNLVAGDIAIKVYTASRCDHDAADASSASPSPPPPSTLLVKRNRATTISLLRFLDLSSSPGLSEQDVIRALKLWKPEAAEPIEIDDAIQAKLQPDDLQLMLDMMSARAFAGSGRTFEVYGQAQHWKSLLHLKNLSLAERTRAFSEEGTLPQTQQEFVAGCR